MAEGEKQRAPRDEADLHQALHRRQDRDQVALVVHGSAAPDEAVGDCALEGRMGPLVEGALGHGHHVLMRQQQHGFEPGIATRPSVEEAQLVGRFEGA